MNQLDYFPHLTWVPTARHADYMAETRDARINAAHVALQREFIDAAMKDADALVRCPSDENPNATMTPCDIVLDAMGADSLESWGIRREVVGVIADAARRGDSRAVALLKQIAEAV
jgi:hypothetical protein